MDEKGCRIACPAGEKIVVPIGVKEMYVGVPENRLSLTVIESISADGKAIPPVVIVPGKSIMVNWFAENMRGHEVITVSDSGYTNESICMTWLDHFIKHNNCGPDQPWNILLIDGATCHEAPEFIIKAKMNRIWPVKFPSHQTHLLEPLDVGCFRAWKTYQQSAIMNAIRSFEPEYCIQSFFRDLPQIRSRTFKARTIKHAFADAGMWPLSFKAIQRKLKEYGKKKKRDTGLAFLEYSSDSEEEQANEIEPFQLPTLRTPQSYHECISANNELDDKIDFLLSSPSRAKYRINRQATDIFLSRGSLYEMEIECVRKGQVETHKRKLDARKSLQKGGSLLASDALQRSKIKRREQAQKTLRKAQKAVQIEENKRRKAFQAQGVQARREERARINLIRAATVRGEAI